MCDYFAVLVRMSCFHVYIGIKINNAFFLGGGERLSIKYEIFLEI